MKDKAIHDAMVSIENRVRHVYNQGFEEGRGCKYEQSDIEAAYQREVYKIIEAGGSVQAETLSGIYKDILTRFWGDAVELTEGAELTWMRQPHYYMGLYSYTYSAGLTISTKMCKRILEEGAPAVVDWKKALRAGSTVNPLEFAQMAGVDISTDGPLNETIEYIGSLIDEMIKLTDQIEG